MNTQSKQILIKLTIPVFLGIGIITALADCVSTQMPGGTWCQSNSDCSSYNDPEPWHCNSGASYTGNTNGTNQTSTVTEKVMSGGSCNTTSYTDRYGNPLSLCSGGTQTDSWVNNSYTDYYCQSCGG